MLPAGLVRLLAADPDSTWYRMLTDPARRCAELSSTGYRPSPPLWRQPVAQAVNCLLPPCGRAATECELDHQQPYPEGETSSANMGPLCKRDHKAKHADGFTLTRDPAGNLIWTTRAGFSHACPPAEQPVGEHWPDPAALEHRYPATRILDALRMLDSEDRLLHRLAAQHWEQDKLAASYRASYPDARDDDIHYWVHGDPAETEDQHHAPPLLREGYTREERDLHNRLRRGTHLTA